jgi:hypothetical protein
MSYSANVFKVMIASPSDVNIERGIVREVLADWNAINSEKYKAVLMPVGWETHSSPAMGGTPQSIINETVLRDCDLLVGIFWTRVGTATEEYASGTVEEIERHINAGRPTMLYFSSAPVRPDSVDPEQYGQLTTFKEGCKSRGLFESYADIQDFRSKLSRHIQLKLNNDPYFSLSDSITIQSFATPVVVLSPEAQELLKAAATSDGHIMRLESLDGTRIQAGARRFGEMRNSRSAAVWGGAVDELVNAGFVQDAGYKREVFKVTREGYEYYDSYLKDKS